MASMQDRILKTVEDKLTEAGFEYAKSTSWANILTIRVFEPGALTQAFEIYLNFQDSYVSGGILLEGDSLINSSPYRNNQRIEERSLYSHYAKAADMISFVSKIERAISERAPAKRAGQDETCEAVYSPMEALTEIEQLLDGVGNPDDDDDYVGRALKIARETVKAHAHHVPARGM